MFNKDLLKQLIFEQRDSFLKLDRIMDREVLHDVKLFRMIKKLKEAIIITGICRVGKLFLLKLIWRKIQLEDHISTANFLYFSFEHEKLLKFTSEDFSLLLETYLELFKVNKKQKIYLFFNEIQNIPA